MQKNNLNILKSQTVSDVSSKEDSDVGRYHIVHVGGKWRLAISESGDVLRIIDN